MSKKWVEIKDKGLQVADSKQAAPSNLLSKILNEVSTLFSSAGTETSENETVGIAHLSGETLHAIFSFFGPADKKTLENARAVCTTFYCLASNQIEKNMGPRAQHNPEEVAQHIMYNRVSQALKLLRQNRSLLLEACMYKPNPNSPHNLSKKMTPYQYARKYHFDYLADQCAALMTVEAMKQQDYERMAWEIGVIDESTVDMGSDFSMEALKAAGRYIKPHTEDEELEIYRGVLNQIPSWLLGLVHYYSQNPRANIGNLDSPVEEISNIIERRSKSFEQLFSGYVMLSFWFPREGYAGIARVISEVICCLREHGLSESGIEFSI